MSSIWHRTLVYFGLAEDESLYDDDFSTVHDDPEPPSRSRSAVRRLDRKRSTPTPDYDDAFHEEETAAGRPRRGTASGEIGVLRSAPDKKSSNAVRVHVIAPRSYNDAQQIADKFKDGQPVIMNLEGTEREVSRRLIDFASGLTYALDGGMSRIADKVFLLTPRNVEVSAEERARLLEKGFYNQY
jgi:cell division inhibitor SepF